MKNADDDKIFVSQFCHHKEIFIKIITDASSSTYYN
ncbi:MAG: hypothetical protein ACI87N_000354 [Flavobacteriales bacterium]|jgi:hypothetical protein